MMAALRAQAAEDVAAAAGVFTRRVLRREPVIFDATRLF